MAAFSGTDNLKKSGIYGPSDLLPFPWEKEAPQPLTNEEIDDMSDFISSFNKTKKSD